MSTSQLRIHEIDGLRGIAILSVVIFHWFVLPLTPALSQIGLAGVLKLLAYGVDLFFVISGFLIGTILLRIEGISGVASFYVRRVLRIWPLYYLLLFVVYSVLPDKSMFSATPYWSFFSFTFNFWESVGKGVHQALGPLWSIAIEEQFYLLGPLIFATLDRKRISFWLLAYVLLSPILRLALLSYTNIDIWRFTPARLDGISIGLLLAMFLSSSANVLFVSRRIKYFKGLTFLLLISLLPSIVIFPKELWASFGHSLVVLAFGCVVLVVQVQRLSNKEIRFLNSSFLRYLGLRCYSIYLFHIFFALVASAVFDNLYGKIIISSVLVLLFAHISWRYIESPLIRLGQRFSYRQMPQPDRSLA